MEKEDTPPSVSKLKLSGDSLGFVSGCSTTVLRPRGSKPLLNCQTVVLKLPEWTSLIQQILFSLLGCSMVL